MQDPLIGRHNKNAVNRCRYYSWIAFAILSALLALAMGILFGVFKSDYHGCLEDYSTLQDENNQLKQQISDLKSQMAQLYYQKELLLENMKLRELHLVYDQTQLPAVTEGVPTIRKLDLSGNLLQTFDGNVLPDLEYLDLRGNPNLSSFSSNNLLKLSTLLTDGHTISNFSNNSMHRITGSLGLNAVLFNGNDMPLLNKLEISANVTTGRSFNNNNMSKLNELSLRITEAGKFENNQLPQLSILTFRYGNPSSTLSSNFMPKLVVLNAGESGLNSLVEILGSYPLLKQARLNSNMVASVTGLTHSNITYLNLDNNRINQSFSSNSFPSLTQLNLNSNPIVSFVSNSLPRLTSLRLESTLLTNLALSDQLGNITSLDLYGSDRLQSLTINNQDGPLTDLDLRYTKLSSFSNYNLSYLQTLHLGYTRSLTNFTGNTFPSLKQLYLYNCSLAVFQCDNLTNLEYLNLSGNTLTDQVADTLLGCFLNKIRDMHLENNKISNTTYVVNKLKQQYPQARVYV